MDSSSGVGGTSPKPGEISGMGEKGPGDSDLSGLMHTKVSTLGELKSLLISHLGEKKGTKFYNEFLTSFGMLMLQQIQESAEQARQAAQNMRMDT